MIASIVTFLIVLFAHCVLFEFSKRHVKTPRRFLEDLFIIDGSLSIIAWFYNAPLATIALALLFHYQYLKYHRVPTDVPTQEFVNTKW